MPAPLRHAVWDRGEGGRGTAADAFAEEPDDEQEEDTVTSRKRRMALVFICLALLSGETAGKAEGMFGYIDREGNPVIPCQFSYAYAFYSGRARVFFGTLNQNG